MRGSAGSEPVRRRRPTLKTTSFGGGNSPQTPPQPPHPKPPCGRPAHLEDDVRVLVVLQDLGQVLPHAAAVLGLVVPAKAQAGGRAGAQPQGGGRPCVCTYPCAHAQAHTCAVCVCVGREGVACVHTRACVDADVGMAAWPPTAPPPTHPCTPRTPAMDTLEARRASTCSRVPTHARTGCACPGRWVPACVRACVRASLLACLHASRRAAWPASPDVAREEEQLVLLSQQQLGPPRLRQLLVEGAHHGNL